MCNRCIFITLMVIVAVLAMAVPNRVVAQQAVDDEGFAPLDRAIQAMSVASARGGPDDLLAANDELSRALDGLDPHLGLEERFNAAMFVGEVLVELVPDANELNVPVLERLASGFYGRAADLGSSPEMRFAALDGQSHALQAALGIERQDYQLVGDRDALLEIIPLWEEIRETSAQLYGPDHVSYGVISLDLAHLYHGTNRPELAIELYQQAIRIFLANWQTGTLANPELSHGLRGYAWDAELALYDALMSQAATSQAARTLQSFAAAVKDRDDILSYSDAVNRLGMHYYYDGDRETSILYYNSALKIAQSASEDDNRQLVAVIYDNMAAAYLAMRDLENAALANQLALLGLRALDQSDPYIANDIMKSTNNYASILVAQGKYQQAFDILKSIRDERQDSEVGVCVSCGIQDYNIAELMLSWFEEENDPDKLDESLKYAKQSLDVNLRGVGPLLLQTADAYSLLGKVHLARNELTDALTNTHAAIDTYRRLVDLSQLDRGTYASISQRDELLRLEILWKQGGGEENFEEALESAQAIAWGSTAEASALFADRLIAGDAKVANALRAKQDAASRLSDVLFQLGRAVPFDTTGNEQLLALRAEMQRAEADLLNAEQSLAELAPAYADARRPTTLTERQIKDRLGENDVLITFVVGSSATYRWEIDKHNPSRWARIEITDEDLAQSIQILRCGLDKHLWKGISNAECPDIVGFKESSPPPYRIDVAYDLFKKLFGTGLSLAPEKHLVIVASGPLTSLPFYALVTQPPEGQLATAANAGQTRWLVSDSAISVLPSVASLMTNVGDGLNEGRYLAFGDPVLAGNCRPSPIASVETCDALRQGGNLEVAAALRLSRDANEGLDRLLRDGGDLQTVVRAVKSLCRLPETSLEVECVSEAVPSTSATIVLGPAATEVAVKALDASGKLATYSIIHFATHGLVAGDVSRMTKRLGEPALVLTPPDTPVVDGDDGLLTASEIAKLHLDADWVILSACNTAAPSGPGAEALSGLAQAFIYAGSRALLVSHWPVYADVAVKVTTQTFNELAGDNRVGRAEALRRSIVSMMVDPSNAENFHPSVWAPFFLVGY